MIDLERLRIFHAVAKSGSVTGAAVQLGLSQPAISRQVATLEDQLRISLFHRHTRGLVLTEQGERLFDAVKDVFSTLMMTEAILSENMQPKGALRIACSDGFGALWLAPRIEGFLAEYPDITLSIFLLSDDQEIDLSVREADMAIQSSLPDDPRLIAVPFLTSTPRIYASKSYLEEHSSPTTFHELSQHRLITFSQDPQALGNWLLTAGCGPEEEARKPFLTFNNVYGILQAVKNGIGIAALHDYVAQGHPELVEVLREETSYAPSIQRFMVYPEPLRHSKRISAFRNFLLRKVVQS